MGKIENKCLILFSGGLDSTTTLYYALDQKYLPITLSFFYHQRHSVEIDSASKIIQHLNESRGAKIQHIKYSLDDTIFAKSSLTQLEIEVPKHRSDIRENIIPSTYVPSRNLVFLSIAMAYAEAHEISEIFIGVNVLDYSGYPDCRPDFIKSFEETARLGTKSGREGHPIQIRTPLIQMTKKEIIKLGNKLGVPFELTWSCYDPQEKNGIVTPCGHCDSCILRKQGFLENGIPDTW